MIDKPHNLIRHPNMPRAVFKLLWDTLQAGEDIARNIEEASNVVAEISGGITSVSQNADQVSESSGDVLSISGDLTEQAIRLQDGLNRKA